MVCVEWLVVVVVLGVVNDSSNQIELFTDIEKFLGGGWWWWVLKMILVFKQNYLTILGTVSQES